MTSKLSWEEPKFTPTLKATAMPGWKQATGRSGSKEGVATSIGQNSNNVSIRSGSGYIICTAQGKMRMWGLLSLNYQEFWNSDGRGFCQLWGARDRKGKPCANHGRQTQGGQSLPHTARMSTQFTSRLLWPPYAVSKPYMVGFIAKPVSCFYF